MANTGGPNNWINVSDAGFISSNVHIRMLGSKISLTKTTTSNTIISKSLLISELAICSSEKLILPKIYPERETISKTLRASSSLISPNVQFEPSPTTKLKDKITKQTLKQNPDNFLIMKRNNK